MTRQTFLVAVALALVSIAASDVRSADESRVVEPKTLNGRPRFKDPRFEAVAKNFVDGMKAKVPGPRSAVGGFYGDPANLVAVQAVATAIADPEKEVGEAIETIRGLLEKRS